MIIDAGIGDKMDAKSIAIYGDRSLAEPGSFAGRRRAERRQHRRRARVAPALRSCRRLYRCVTRDGTLVPRFPAGPLRRAHGEWEDATHPHERNRASYLPENFVPLMDAGVLDLVPGDERDHARRPGGAHRRAHDAPPDRHHRIGRPHGGIRRRSDPDDRARRRAVDHGIRPVPDGHAGVQADIHSRGDRARISDLLRARSGRRRRLHPREGRPEVRRAGA